MCGCGVGAVEVPFGCVREMICSLWSFSVWEGDGDV
jgi:hypothetical protein